MKQIETFRQEIAGAEKIAVITHMHPDGDALGSSCAMVNYLRASGKEDVSLICEEFPRTIAFIGRNCSPIQGEKAKTALLEADLVIITDFSKFSRSADMENALESSRAFKVMLDHHPFPDVEKVDLAFCRTEVSSASEIVYYVLKDLCRSQSEMQQIMGGDCGYCLLCGMTADTDNFSFSTWPETFRMASELLSFGIDRKEIVANLYNNYRRNRVAAMSFFLSEKLTIRPDGLACLMVSKEDWNRFGLLEGELEGLVNIPMSIGEVKMSIYFREDEENTVRVSIRAKEGWSAADIASRYFHGGGHVLASGGKLHIPEDIASFEEVLNYLEQVRI